MQLSKKQNEYILHATHRWNIKSGAVRSGKSFVDTAYIVPFRIRERKGKPEIQKRYFLQKDFGCSRKCRRTDFWKSM